MTSLLVALSACGGSGSDSSAAEPITFASSLRSTAPDSVFSSSSSLVSALEPSGVVASSSVLAATSVSHDTISSSRSAISSLNSSISSVSATLINSSSLSITSSSASSHIFSSSSVVIASSSAAADIQVPKVSIMFPTPVALTAGDSILVRGTASDDLSGIVSLQVNGVEVSTTDNYANWQLKVPLALGLNNLTVSARDAANNSASDAASLSVNRETLMYSPNSVAIDEANKRALVLDSGNYQKLVSVNLQSGLRTLVSENPGFEPVGNDGSMAGDLARNRALVVDHRLQAILAVDLITGERVYFSR